MKDEGEDEAGWNVGKDWREGIGGLVEWVDGLNNVLEG